MASLRCPTGLAWPACLFWVVFQLYQPLRVWLLDQPRACQRQPLLRFAPMVQKPSLLLNPQLWLPYLERNLFPVLEECRGFRSPNLFRSRDCRQPGAPLTSFTNLLEAADSSLRLMLLKSEQTARQHFLWDRHRRHCSWTHVQF